MPVPPFRKHVPGKRSNASCSYSKTVTVSTALTNQTNILLAKNTMLDQAGPIYGYYE